MKIVRILLGAAMLMAAGSVCLADATSDLAKENTELRQRVDRLEKELEELKKMVMRQAVAAKARPKPSVMPQLNETDMQRIMAMVQQETSQKKAVWSNLDIQLYGYIKLDAAYDTSRVSTGDFIRWVDSEATRQNDNEFNITANQSRLGINITGPEDNGIVTSGRVEIDFYGSGADENKSKIMLRHAYLKLDWPEERFNIIAGQSWDVISPLCPGTLNYSVMWWSGNIGYRHPQIRLTKSFLLKDGVDFKLEGAISRTIGDDELLTTNGAKAGEDSGIPTLQGRASLTFPWFGYKPTTVGISGHWGKEEYDDISTTSSNEEFDTWSLNVDMTQPINKWLTFKGELFTGENLDNYLGGIGQGIDSTTSGGITTYHDKIASKGGWVAASLGPWDKWRFNVGAGMDDVDAGDLGDTGRTLNQNVFGNVIYAINKNTEVGFELSQWHTERKDEGNANDFRAQTSFIYKF